MRRMHIDASSRGREPRRARNWALALTSVLVGLVSFPALGGGAISADVGGVRTILEQWVETRRLISREKHDWEVGNEVLRDRIDIVRRDVGSVRARIAEAEASIAQADEAGRELIERCERLRASSSALAEGVARLEARVGRLLKHLPEPARERVRPLSSRIPGDSDGVELTLSERFQNVVGVLDALDKFHREITLTSEVRDLGDGAAAEVTALYFGIGQGWYVSTRSDAAGVGRPTPEGWSWVRADDEAGAITRAIATLKNEREPAFVPLSIRVE